MFWNEKLCILMKKFAKYVHLDYSGSFDMHIEKWKKNEKNSSLYLNEFRHNTELFNEF